VPAKADETLRRLGFTVRRLRRQRKLSQEELADVAGLHRTYIGSIERGERNLTLKGIEAVATALGISASQLLSEAEALKDRDSRY